MRQAIEVSANVPHVKALSNIGTEASIDFCESIGMPRFEEEGLSLALGGLQHGISPTHMAAGYSSIANGGTYKTPIFYTKVTDSQGNVLYEPEKVENRVMTEQVAYIASDILKQPVISGTATYCKIAGMDVAAKTGTTNDDYDRWLCGFTPYYTAATWYGYDTQTSIPSGSRTNATTIWDNVMTSIHKDLKSASFKKPDNIISVSVCKDSGLRATEICKNDPRGSRVYTEYFAKGTAPTKTCTCHVEAEVCTTSNKVSGEFCLNREKKIFITRTTEKKVWEKAGDAEYMLTEEICDVCKADTTLPVITIIGGSTLSLNIGDTYTELGATAYDNVDGDISLKIITTGTVNTSVAGNYTITYTVSDMSGNIGTATRTVNVSVPTPVTPPVVTEPPVTETPTVPEVPTIPTDPTINSSVQ